MPHILQLMRAFCEHCSPPPHFALLLGRRCWLQAVSRESLGGPPRATFRLTGCGAVFNGKSTLFRFPMDVVKTRMQSEPIMSLLQSPPLLDHNNVNYLRPDPSISQSSVRSTIEHTYRTGGWRVFFAGFWPTMLRAIPVNMVSPQLYSIEFQQIVSLPDHFFGIRVDRGHFALTNGKAVKSNAGATRQTMSRLFDQYPLHLEL